ncbi:Na(+)/H(+) antiporter subunit C [Ornithinimicrobium faecis]|uniref:Na(+)/H(+) antiporter subunit C n=1 Tax=Ornithinimicrobium faecis TaxID=2934158 RepID=A0ABY4YU95_9MICO|nr:Na(+)/H(+) antiporter subunit C [Ornithinimicrobium sp. HY1793]USQ80040.1 Na(+)/H(+) antiporter subunit C [Ornithinimicrobium sp. HY1793]
MSPNITLILVAATLLGTGVYLLLARSIVRALVGFLLMGNGINILFMVASGPAGDVPILDQGDPDQMADPIPQALVLTAIVITLAMTAFVLSLAHRAWQLGRDDLLEDDEESARIHRRAEENDMSGESTDDADVIAAEFAEEDTGEEER